jgi:hypothetical protein
MRNRVVTKITFNNVSQREFSKIGVKKLCLSRNVIVKVLITKTFAKKLKGKLSAQP